MDELDLWQDTLLIVNTDHGFLMGEHDWWAKCRMPFWQEIAHIPLWIWDPRSGRRGERRESLVQTIDLAPTLLEYFGLPIPTDVQGRPLRATIERDAPVRDAGLYGIHGGHVNVTDGRYVYMRAPATDRPLFEYTLMPTRMRGFFGLDELRAWKQHGGFAFTKGCPVARVPARHSPWLDADELVTRLYDLEGDYEQQRPLEDATIDRRMIDHLIARMRASEAPEELYVRLGLEAAVKRTERAVPASAR
jgi:arylsulfatase A-like enzyme